MKPVASTLPDLPYERAPDGSPDKFRLTRDTLFQWKNPPAWIWELTGVPVKTPAGIIMRSLGADGSRELLLWIYAGFFFAVSVAPNFARALAAACVHDWIYANVKALALAWGCTARRVLHLADHWFLSQMWSSGFGLKRTYFCFVRIFGYGFNRLFNKDKT